MSASLKVKTVVRHRLRLLYKQINIQLRMRVLSGYTLLLLVVQPVVFSGIGFMLAKSAGRDAPDLIYTIMGGGFMGLWSGVLFTSFNDITRDRAEGTLELIVGSPTSLSEILAIRILANVLTGLVSVAGAFAIAFEIFDFPISSASIPSLLVSFCIVFFSFWCLGLLLANFHALSRGFGMFINYLEMPIAVFSGLMFPVTILPGWIAFLSSFMSVRWAVAAVNESLSRPTEQAAIYQDWLIALLLSSLYLFLARLFGLWVQDKIRVSGELSSI